MTLATLKKRITRTKISWIFFLMVFTFCFVHTNAQTGLNFQGVARNSNNVILASQQISLRLSILQGTASGSAEYTETRIVTTNAQGLFTAVIGDAGATSTLGNFATINWKNTPKYLKIEMDVAAGNNFITMGTTQFQYVAYAQFANGVDAVNIAGVVPVEKGGTGVSSITALKTALAIDKINNTTDAEKPISTKTQAALDLILVTATDTSRFSSRINAKANTLDVATGLATKVDKVTGKELSTNDYTTVEKIKLSAITGTNTGDQDLSSYATNTSLALKANAVDVTTSLASKVDKVTGKVLSTNDYTAAEKTKLAAITGTNTGDQDLSSYATNAALALKVNTTDVNTALGLKANLSDLTLGLALKENSSNKSSAVDLGGVSPSDILYPTQKAVKAYVTANSASGGIADGGITNIKLADGAVNYAKFQSIPTNTILGNTTSSTAVVQAIATTGSDNVVLSTSPLINSPTLVTPNLGIATATSLNNITMTAAGGNPAILSVIGNASIKRDNNGDDAPNQRYENLLTDAVSLTTSQPIDGQKTFQNNLVMGAMGGIVGTNTPTTINFANGSRIGDIQNIEAENPDGLGSIDLYAPDRAKWVQMNYGNTNYIGLRSNRAFIEVGEEYWKFNNNGSTDLPGDLNFTDNHAINFTSTGTSTPTTNTSITSEGPYLKLATRAASEDELNEEVYNGIELNYADRNYLWLREDMYFLNHDDDVSNENYSSEVFFGYDNFDFFINNNLSRYNWKFKDDGSTVLPGALLLTGNIETAGTLKLGSTIFTNQPATNGYVLTYNNGNATWSAPTGGAGISIINGVSSGTQSFTSSNSGNDFSIQSDASTGIHTFNLPDASTSKRGLLTSADYATFYAKQNALTNPLTGTGTSGQLSFFNGTSTVTSSSDLFWDATNKRLGIGNQSPGYPVEINTGNANYGLMISSESSNSWGSGIGFKSSIDATTKTGLFQLDRDGAMVFRTLQDNMYFDNSGTGSIKFRMGNPSANIGMSLNNSGDLEIKGTLKAGPVLYPNVSGTLGDVLTADASGNPIWQAPTGTNVSNNVDASTLSGTTLKSTVINSSLTSVGTLANLTVTNPINGSITGNAATVTNNANLTGVVTSVGNITSIATGTISNSMLANTAVANLSGVNTGDNSVNARYNYLITDVANLLAGNTGDNAINSRYNSLVTNAVHYGDIKALMTGSDGYNVIGINGTRLLDLQTGILKNTTGTGVPSIAVASDFPTLNQSTTGNAATATKFFTSRKINEVAFDGTGDITIAANAGTLTGTTLNATVINSSLTSVGTLSNLTVTNPINGSINGNAASATIATTAGTASTATKLATARNINGVPFDGSAAITVTADAGTLTGTTLKSTIINSSLTSVGTLVNLSVTNPISGSITGNAATATLASSATKLATSRNINGIAFDGTGDITVAANAGTLTGTSLNTTITGSSLTSVGVLNNATVNGKVIVGAAAESSSSAILEASSTTQGFLPPRMTIAQRLAITNPAQGLMIYCTNCGTYGEPQYYNGNAWLNFAGTASSKGTPIINITVGTYTYTGSAQGPNTATNTGTGSTYAYTYVGTGSTTYASSSTRPTNAGTYSVTVSLSASGDGNYNAATASAAFTIAQAIPTVTPTIGTYGYISGTPQGPTTATNTGTGTSYTYSYTGTGITTYGPSATKPTDGGTYTVIATVAANVNYAASSSAPTAFSIKTNLAVGNTYGGGTVAYILGAGDIGYDVNQQHGLIISGNLTPNNIVWSSNYGTMGSSGGAGIYNNDTGIEDFPSADLQTGLSNTNIIINVEGSGTSYAARIARAYTGGNYTNWYLPSASQMNAMKSNLITPFTTNYFWTSTEDGDYNAYAYSVPLQDVSSIDKISAQGKVRAVRSF